jgi:hypothetical protein
MGKLSIFALERAVRADLSCDGTISVKKKQKKSEKMQKDV